ncbi:MAG: hypothetical protein ACRCX2_19535 [Paraclostridium sp.]
MRHCKLCDRTLTVDSFPISKGVHIKKCRECKRKYDREWKAAKRKREMIETFRLIKNKYIKGDK